MYKNYIFDLYGTLIDINTDEEKDELWNKLSSFYSFKGALYSMDELKKAYSKKVEKHKNLLCNTMYPDFPLENVFLELYTDKSIYPSKELIEDTAHLFRIISTDYIKLYPGAIELLDTLKKNNKKIYLLSNAQRIFTMYEMKVLGIYDYFDDIFFSSDYKVCKPDINFYNKLINKHNLDISETIMIGNDYIADIYSAHSAGLSSFYMHSNLSPDIEGELLSTYSIMECDIAKIAPIIVTT